MSEEKFKAKSLWGGRKITLLFEEPKEAEKFQDKMQKGFVEVAERGYDVGGDRMKDKLDKFLKDFRVTVNNPQGDVKEGVSKVVYANKKQVKEKITCKQIKLFNEIFEPIRYNVWLNSGQEYLFLEGVLKESDEAREDE